jgi:hypothetical protein
MTLYTHRKKRGYILIDKLRQISPFLLFYLKNSKIIRDIIQKKTLILNIEA